MIHVLILETLAINSSIVIRILYILATLRFKSLTTNHFFKLPFNSTITIFPAIRHTLAFPFNNIADHELEPIHHIEELNVRILTLEKTTRTSRVNDDDVYIFNDLVLMLLLFAPNVKGE